jgi:hypothetical protein
MEHLAGADARAAELLQRAIAAVPGVARYHYWYDAPLALSR